MGLEVEVVRSCCSAFGRGSCQCRTSAARHQRCLFGVGCRRARVACLPHPTCLLSVNVFISNGHRDKSGREDSVSATHRTQGR
jgi:hypothetical protein